MAHRGATLLASVFALLLIAAPTAHAAAATVGLTVKLFCDECGNGVFDAVSDVLLSGVSVSAVCTVTGSNGQKITYATATVSTDSNGVAVLPFTGATTDTSSILTLLTYLMGLGFTIDVTHPLANTGALLQAALTGKTITGAALTGCKLTTSTPTNCPNLKFSSGNCLLGVGVPTVDVNALGTAVATDITKTTAANGLLSLSLTDDVCFAPDTMGTGCGGGSTGGDPHFRGADGSQFDFSGEPNENYCLLSDSHLHINTFYGGRWGQYEKNPHKALNWIRKIGILWGHHTIMLAVREGARWQYDQGYMSHIEIDGMPIVLSQPGDLVSMVDGHVQIKWVAAKEQSADDLIDVYEVRIEGVMTMILKLRPEVWQLRTDDDGLVHFDIEWADLDVSDHTHGVLGQTYRQDFLGRVSKQNVKYSELLKVKVVEGDNAEGFLDGQVADYRSSDLLKADCKFSRFTRATRRDTETARALEVSAGQAVSTLSISRKMLAGKLSIL